MIGSDSVIGSDLETVIHDYICQLLLSITIKSLSDS